ncbi:hypothetical protein ACG1BZ_16600 [Microbulbifer sp. CNSA002]|uniref:hypothetical protein n=1 Tax=Microbulbifer sp. CNSA002 TaxID=3373604 RepID=UPI0039B5B398
MPKLYFGQTGLAETNGAQVHVRYSYGSIFHNLPCNMNFDGQVTTKLNNAIPLALQALNYVHDRFTGGHVLSDPEGKYSAERYFKIYELQEDHCWKIALVIKMMVAGLNTNRTVVKVFRGLKGHPTVNGYVTSRNINTPKKHRNHAIHHFTKKDGNPAWRPVNKGDVHMKVASIMRNCDYVNAVLFLHEASHKYASTADFGEKGYTVKNTGAYREGGLTTEQALINAESYGKFIMDYYIKQNSLNIAIW